MKKLFSLLWIGVFLFAGVTMAQATTPTFEEAYTQLLQYAQQYSLTNESFEKSSFSHQLGIKWEIEGTSFKANILIQGKHDKKLGDMQNSIAVEGEFAEGIDFFGQVKLLIHTIIQEGNFFYNISDVSGSLSEYGEQVSFGEYFDTELTNTWIKSDSDYLDLGMSYIDTSFLKLSSFQWFSLPNYPLWEVISQEGNSFTLGWNKLNLARFLNEEVSKDLFAKQILWELLRDIEDTPITMQVKDNSTILSFSGEDGEVVLTFSPTTLSLKYQDYSDLFYLILKKWNTSDKLGFIIVEDSVAQVLGAFDLQFSNNPAISQTLSIKGNIRALEDTFEDFNLSIDYLWKEQAEPTVTIQAPIDYINLEEYYWKDYEDWGDYEDETDFENSREYYDYYYVEEQEQYGKFCDSDEKDCVLSTKAEILALPSCKAYFASYAQYISQFEKDEQWYFIEELLDELASLQEVNLNYVNYFCEYYGDYYTTSDEGEAVAEEEVLPTFQRNPLSQTEIGGLKVNSIIQGDPKAEITILEFADVNCGYCKRQIAQDKTIQTLMNSNPNINTIYKNMPVLGSYDEAKALVCFGIQNDASRYYDFIEAVYGMEDSSLENILDLAETMWTDKEKMKTCNGRDSSLWVDSEFALGKAFWITGTPSSVIINTTTGKWQVIQGASPLSEFEKTIKELSQ